MNTVKIQFHTNSNNPHKLIIDNDIAITFDNVHIADNIVILSLNGKEVATFRDKSYDKLLEVFDY